ncbi:MAG: DNA primase [Casimicrobiaceae bacterium]
MIPEDFIQQLLARVDIVEVIDRRVPLKKAGQNYQACCPFHKEKTPSFTVSPAKQFYHCFGCGAHGSAIGFLMEYAGLSFRDAVAELAQSVGLAVPEDGERRRDPQISPLMELMQRAAVFYREQLRRSKEAVAYLKRRGITGEMARRYQLGWAPAGWQALAEVFDDYASNPLLELAGLVNTGEGRRRYDRFRGRVMFPILSTQGAVIAFGGRVLASEAEGPKYLNSPETPLFSKGRELYGVFQAQASIRKRNQVIVVEGYMDVIALAQHGVENVVATLGTATTAERLLRMADDVVYAFDGDAAGQRAAWRALENTLPALRDGKQVRFLFLPVEHDPDSYIVEHGGEAFERLVAAAEPLSVYWLRQLRLDYPGESAESKAARAQAGRAHLARVAAPMLRESLAAALARDTDLAVASLLAAREPAQAPSVPPAREAIAGTQAAFARRLSARPPARPAVARTDPATQQVRAAARRLLSRPGHAVHLVDLVLPESPPPRPVQLLQAVVAVCLRQGPKARVGALVEAFRDSEFAQDVEALALDRDSELDALLDDEALEAELRRLRERLEAGSLFVQAPPVAVPAGLTGSGIIALVPQRQVVSGLSPGPSEVSPEPAGAGSAGEADAPPF